MAPFDGPLPPGMIGAPGAGAGAPAGGPPGMPPITPAAMPPSLRAAPPGAGPTSMPQGNPGNSMAALALVQTAVTMLQKALPSIPMGSDAHNDVLKAVSTLSKHVSDAQDSQSQIQQLMAMIQSTAQNKPQEALAKLAPQGAPPALPSPPPGMAGGAGAPPDMSAP